MRFLLDIKSNPNKLYIVKDSYIKKCKIKNDNIENKLLLIFFEKSNYINVLLDLTECIISKKEIPHYLTKKTDGDWIWSADIEYYIKEHNFLLPKEFIQHIESKNYKIDEMSKEDRRVLYFNKYKPILNENGLIDLDAISTTVLK